MTWDQPWVFFGRNNAKAETPVLWPPHAKSWLTGKDSDAGRDWGQEEKGMTEDEMAGWHHWLDGLESEWTQRVGDGQGGLACCDSWGHKESDMTEWLNWTELNEFVYFSSFLSSQWLNLVSSTMLSHVSLWFYCFLLHNKILYIDSYMSVVSFWDFMRLWVRKFKFTTTSVRTSWLYMDNSYVPKQFL